MELNGIEELLLSDQSFLILHSRNDGSARDNNSAVTPAFLNPRVRSLARGNILVVGSLVAATLISGFPHMRTTPLLILPLLGSLLGTIDTIRCIRRRWSFYHGGVILCIYMDLMAVSITLFFLLYPYFLPFTHSQ